MKMNAEHYTPVSDKLIPTGEIAPVQGTVFDLRQPTRQGEGLLIFSLKKNNVGILEHF
jgi:aldose 1-epimerase